jgi:predicted PurR-regulated permease PerM
VTRPDKTTIVLLGILTAILVGWVLRVGAEILQPLVLALLLCSMLQPVVKLLARWRIPPALTVILIVSALFYGMARGGLAFYAYVVKFAGTPPEALVAPVLPDETEGPQGEETEISWTTLRRNIEDKINGLNLSEEAKNFAIELLRSVDVKELTPRLIGSALGFSTSLVLVVIYMLFIFAEQAVFRRKILAIAGERHAEAQQVIEHIGRSIQRYLGVKTVISIATGVLCYVGLRAFSVPNAELYGVLTFLLNYIPTFGSIIAGIFPTVTALTSLDHPLGRGIGVALVYLAVNFTLGSYLEPKIQGRELRLSPLVIVICVVVWGGLWGVVGAFIAVPLTVILQIFLASYEHTKPIAVMLSIGPPRRRRESGEEGLDGPHTDALEPEDDDELEARWRRPG